MSIHNICFHGEIRKNINTYGLKKNHLNKSYASNETSMVYLHNIQSVYLMKC